MHVTLLRMISTNSLQAFSGAITTQPVDRATPIRLARDRPEADVRYAAPAPAIPETRPSVPPPRGTLLNLSI